MYDPNEVDFDAVVNDIDAVSGNGLDMFEDEDSVTASVQLDADGDRVVEGVLVDNNLDTLVHDQLVDEEDGSEAKMAAVPVVKAESKMDVARRIFNEEVAKLAPGVKLVRKDVIKRFMAEGNMGMPYAATAYQKLTQK